MRIVDTKGKPCPAPLIAAKKTLNETPDGGSFIILTDNKTSFDNLCRYLRDNNAKFSSSESEGTWTMTVTKAGIKGEMASTEANCNADIPHFTKGNFVIAFSSDKMGDGDDDLGRLLLMNFLKAVKDLDAMPSKMVFYNRGVFLGANDSEVFQSLLEIERMGVGMFLCGTCIKHYSLEEKITIGSVSNMFEITSIMASAGNVIKP